MIDEQTDGEVMKLTKKLVEDLEATGKRYEVRDSTVTGFLVRVGASGEKAFYYVYRAGKGRGAAVKRLHIGTFPTIPVEYARDIARQKAAQVAMGEDPAEMVKAAKNVLTVKEALEMFLEQHSMKVKPATIAQYRRLAEQLVIPALGKYKIEVPQYRHITSLHNSLSKTPYQANRCAALLSKFFSWCEKSGYRESGSNPVRGLEKYTEHKRQQFMGEAELKAIGAAFATLAAHGYCETSTGKFVKLDPIIAAAIKMLIFTGARCNEILTLKWSYVDSAKGLAFLPDSKTGAKVLHLPQPALALLESLPRINEYCFPGRNHKSHLVNIKDTWRRLLETAGLPHGPGGWRIHDLRHAFASYAVSSGKSLPIVGAMLGHTQPTTTQRYAHIAANPVASAAEDTAALLERDLNSGQEG